MSEEAEKGMNALRNIMMGSSILTGALVLSHIHDKNKIKPYIENYAKIAKQLKEHWDKVVKELDDDLLLVYNAESVNTEESLEAQVAVNELHIKILKIHQAKKKARTEEKKKDD